MTSVSGVGQVGSGTYDASVRSTGWSFEALKQKIVAVCASAFEWLKQSLTAGAFLVFRVANYIHPSLGSALEKGYLYVANFFYEYKTKDLKAEINDLNQVNARLVEQRSALERENREVIQERDTLKIQNATLSVQNGNLQDEKQRLLKRLEIAAVDEEELENANQQIQNQETGQRNLLERIKNLELQNQNLQKSVTELQKKPVMKGSNTQAVVNACVAPEDARWFKEWSENPQTI